MAAAASLVMTIALGFWMEHAVWKDGAWEVALLAVLWGVFGTVALFLLTNTAAAATMDANKEQHSNGSPPRSLLNTTGPRRSFHLADHETEENFRRNYFTSKFFLFGGALIFVVFAFYHTLIEASASKIVSI